MHHLEVILILVLGTLGVCPWFWQRPFFIGSSIERGAEQILGLEHAFSLADSSFDGVK
jgi:hypothetical protein